MHLLNLILATLILAFLPASIDARSQRQHFIVQTASGGILVEHFGDCANETCPAVLILSGSKGFSAPAYSEIGQRLHAAGMNAYLVHLLSTDNLNAIATAGSAQARIAYYARRLTDWISAVHGVVAYLNAQPRHDGKVGLLGISLGAQIASAASAGCTDIDALVLVDGAFPNGYSQPVRSLPPLLLIWGSADRTFPLSTGKELQRMAQRLGGPVTLDVYEGGSHDFFLRSGTSNSIAAHQAATDFLARYLSR